jgi:hypothetical protein
MGELRAERAELASAVKAAFAAQCRLRNYFGTLKRCKQLKNIESDERIQENPNESGLLFAHRNGFRRASWRFQNSEGSLPYLSYTWRD